MNAPAPVVPRPPWYRRLWLWFKRGLWWGK
jgi:hypothetical protein